MDDANATLMPMWRANLALLTREVGSATRLARMMTFSASYMKLIVSGQRDFSAEFVRGVEAVTGLPEGWMDVKHDSADVPDETREAIASETPRARFRGTAHPVRKAPVLRVEPIFGQGAKREEVTAAPEAHRRLAGTRKIRDLAAQDVRKLERYLSVPPVEPAVLRSRIEDVINYADPDERVRADLEGRLEQIEKHREMLLRHVSRLYALLSRLGDD
ncbi:hypothetical protein [Paraburkholderia silvatlantica]|uniref:Uncharacterized protein n=1 Tax=Paraburkholderia silvatlantica TaxID=321895 RepID=A0A2U0ZBD4_9BURK|nr:hypothetical protein [Paraburkholderia silvatlantica]MBB2932753.1 hypothetical protein [Paraburkholderia silvatlantica]PVY16213.1 hypothetical protein C7411_1513 [Paraburkholderia silvatlantica]PXW23253.1 hypothetical protein C7413_1553 [Paraburkholderia silvatlantica]PYE12264.1 hypothetical protein C7410_1593 [Paraburkholderia silvatlantica]TDQ72109.1 hypothetical protein C7412_1513 [Paraburkholderia silvatlantica]